MLVKRLLFLPGKGGVITCIFILLNVLCGKPVSSVKVSCGVAGSWTSALSLHFSPFRLALPSIYYSSFSLALVTKFQLISFQLPVGNAEAVSFPQDPTHKPVLNKTDPLLMTGVSRGGKGSSYLRNDNNYNNTRRRTPVYNGNTSSKARSSNYSKNNIVNYALVNVSSSGGGSGSASGNVSKSSGKVFVDKRTVVKLKQSSSSSSSNLRNVTKSSSKLRNVTKSSSKLKNVTKSSSKLKNATKSSKPSGTRQNIWVTIKPRRRKGRTRQPRNNNQNSSTSSSPIAGGRIKARRPKLLKEITLFNRQNCLAKLLCGVQVAQPPTKSSSAVNDYAYLVKAFFDRFSIRGIVTDAIDAAFEYERDGLDLLLDDDAEEEDEEDDSSSERRKKKRTKSKTKVALAAAAAHKSRRPPFENYEPKYYDEYDKDVEDLDLEELLNDDVPEFMQPDFFRRRAGRNMTHVKPFKPPKCPEGSKGNSANLGRKGKRRTKRSGRVPVEIDRIRRKRGIMGSVKRGFMGFFNPRFDKTAYLDKRQLELETTNNKSKQFNIAEEIAARIRSPRQCRLLNWFGNDNNAQNSPNPDRMTTTITTITNTGGMIGYLDRLNGIPNLPQTAVPGNGGSGPGSQVVTVIQQSPVGAMNALLNMPSSTSSSMLNNMGQTASNAMSQASNVASSIGSTICPFNIQELQELILKAQNAQFPHFLTTTPQSPGVASTQAYQPVPAIQVAVPASTKLPPPPSSTVAILVKNPPSSGKNPIVQLYGDFAPAPNPPNSHSHFNSRPFGSMDMYPSPIYPASAYPTFISPQKGSSSRVPQTTRHSLVLPTIGMAGDQDDEGEFDDPFSYEKYSGNNKNLHTFKRKAKPTPKWMTTTTASPNDDYYSNSNALPSYSYGTQQGHGSYKVVHSSQKPPTTAQSIKQNALNNHIRQYHQPPEVFDSKKKYPAGSFHKVQPNSRKKVNTKTPNPVKSTTKPKEQKKKGSSASEENSDEDTSGTSGSEGDLGDYNEEDEEGSDEDEETSSISSGSRERINLNIPNMKKTSPRPPQPIPVVSNSIEASEEEEDGSNEAEELSDGGNNENEEEEEEDAESVEEDDNGGKRSYEHNDFSKDRGGPQSQSSPTVKPFSGTNTITNYGSAHVPSSGFLSNFMNSFGSIFKRKEKIKVQADKASFSYPQPTPFPPRPLAHNDEPSLGSGLDDSEELDEEEGDDYEESAEESDEPILKPKVENAEINYNSLPRPQPKPMQAPTLIPLDTTQLPVIIEESTSWATRYKDPEALLISDNGYFVQDHSGEVVFVEDPVASYNEAVRKNRKKKPTPTVSYNGEHGKHEINLSKYISGLPISTNSWLNELAETKPTPKPKKKVMKDEIRIPTKQTYEEDEEESTESEEDDSSLPRIFGNPSAPQFLPSEPID